MIIISARHREKSHGVTAVCRVTAHASCGLISGRFNTAGVCSVPLSVFSALVCRALVCLSVFLSVRLSVSVCLPVSQLRDPGPEGTESGTNSGQEACKQHATRCCFATKPELPLHPLLSSLWNPEEPNKSSRFC